MMMTQRRRVSLDGRWQYTPQAQQLLRPGGVIVEDTAALPAGGTMTLPACWQKGGLDNFHGRVRFERAFTFAGFGPGEASAWLVFEGVDYYARVWLNGVELGTHEGYFQPFEFDVTAQLQPGENHLVVDVACPREEPVTVWHSQKIMLKGILSHWDCRPGSWDYETGQDLNSGGIWNSVRLELRPAAYVAHVRVQTRLVPGGVPDTFAFTDELDTASLAQQAMVLVRVEVAGPRGDYALEVSLGAEAPVTVPVSQQHAHEAHTVVVRVPQPRLWWTWDTGEPHLEPCRVRLMQAGGVLDTWEDAIGLRELTLNPENGEYHLNGKRFFVRGTSVVPTLWLSEYDSAMIDRDIALLRAAHINGVRVCVHVNRREFYQACDRAGLIVWQDFALQWGYAPTQAVMQSAVRQIREMVRLLANHACIALWVCQNESSFHNKFVLDPVLAAVVAAEDPSRYVRPTSTFSEHTYVGWYNNHYRDYVALPGTPLLSEFGAQALPDVASVRAMVGDAFPPDLDRLAYHDFQYHQTFHVAGLTMGSSLEEFVQQSQAYQAKLLKFAIEHFRRAKYRALGGMYQFMFMDCWPAITWSVVSYERVPKQGYHTLQQVYQPVLIGAPLIDSRILIGVDRGSHERPLVVKPWVVNDRHEVLRDCHYTAALSGMGQAFHFHVAERFAVPADDVLNSVPSLVWDIPPDLPAGRYTLRLHLLQGEQVISHNDYDISFERAEG